MKSDSNKFTEKTASRYATLITSLAGIVRRVESPSSKEAEAEAHQRNGLAITCG